MSVTVDSRMFFYPDDWLDTHTSTDWEVSDTIDFTNILLSSYYDTVNLHTWTIDTTGLPTLVYLRVRYRYGPDGIPTPWSKPIACYRSSWCTLDIQDITSITISGYPDQIERAPIITTNPFSPAAPGEVHISTDWIIEDSNGTVVFESINDTTNLTSIKLPPEYLVEGSRYLIRVRHNGSIVHSHYGTLGFTVRSDPYIETPTVRLSDSRQITTVFTIYGSSFYSNLSTERHIETRYRIIRVSDNTVLYDQTTSTNKTILSIPASLFTETDTYRIEVTYIGNTLVSNTGIQYYETIPVKEWIPYYGNFTLKFSGFSPIGNGSFYTYGGLYNPPVDTIYKHTIDTSNYKIDKVEVGKLPYPIYRPVSVTIDDTVYIIGGITTDDTPVDTYIVHDMVSGTDTIYPLPFTYSHGAGIGIGTDIYLVGGIVDGIVSNSIYKIDTITQSVERYDSLPITLHRHSIVAIGTDIYLVGGIVNDMVSDSVYVYSIDTASFGTLITDTAVARYDLSTIVNGTDIVVIGGRRKKGDLTRDVVTVNTITGQIVTRDPLPIANHGAIVLRLDTTGNQYLVAGGQPDGYRPDTDKDVSYFSIALLPSYTPPNIDPGKLVTCQILASSPVLIGCQSVYGISIDGCSVTYESGSMDLCVSKYNTGTVDTCSARYTNGSVLTCTDIYGTKPLDTCTVVYLAGKNITCSSLLLSGNLISCSTTAVLSNTLPPLSCVDVITTNTNTGYCTSCVTVV